MGAEQPPITVPSPPRDRWPAVRRWLLGAAALLAIGSAVAAILSGEPLFTWSAWTFAALPILYLAAWAISGAATRASAAGIAVGLILVVGASTFVALTSCGNRLEPGADLSGCDLREEPLSGLNLSRANLTGADLSGMNLAKTNFSNADLARANLANARFAETSFSNADLEGADLRNTDLTRTLLLGVSLAGTNLDGVNLRGVDLGMVSFQGASATNADFSNANLAGADFMNARLDGALLDGTQLIGTIGLPDETLAEILGVGVDTLGRALIERDIRLENRQDILGALSGACSGSGVAGAAPYPQGDFHPLVIFDERGGVGVDTDRPIDLGWEPTAVRFAQLVACVSEEEDTTVESCPYTLEGGGSATISRVRYHRDVRVVEAASGRPVFEKTLEGSNPQECPLFHTFSSLNQHETFGGSNVGFSKVQGELARFVS